MNAQAVQPAKKDTHVLVKGVLWLVEFLVNILIGSIRFGVLLGCLYIVFAAVWIYLHPDMDSLMKVIGIAVGMSIAYLAVSSIAGTLIPDDLVPEPLKKDLSLKELEVLCLLTEPRTGSFCREKLNTQSRKAQVEFGRTMIGLRDRHLIKTAGRVERKWLFELTPKGQDAMSAALQELDRVRLAQTLK